MKKLSVSLVTLLVLFLISVQSFTQTVNLDTVKAGRFDGGKMWTFEYPPVDYFHEAYGFRPSQEWLDKVRMSALRFADYCSASFVSEDGLVMTNHHCGRESVGKVQKEGENLSANGFIASTLEEERKVDGLFVDQLVQIIDVTKEVLAAMDIGMTIEEKSSNGSKKISEIEDRISKETGNRCQVTALYNGGIYSAYVYKRYNDVRLVFAPEDQIGFFGGDYDNFTYPRYNLDLTMFRVYDESGSPLKTDNYFKWSKYGASVGEPIFVVGNPGSTSRLLTVSQLQYNGDIEYPFILRYIDNFVDSLQRVISSDPSMKEKVSDQLFNFMNSQKAYKGMVEALRNPYLMAKKKDFEKNFKNAVNANPKLKKEYGNAWAEIEDIVKQKRNIYEQNRNKSFRELYMKLNQLSDKEDYYKQLLGRAVYEVYGTSIPPDATFTLRLSDGVIKTYEYNGTIAPPKTTFYGLLDRYWSFAKEYPWSLHERWQNIPPEFNLETPFNFVSTNDIIGGNSGSPMINKDLEVVGLVFDGNIESMSSEFIYTSEFARTVSVDSQGLMECIKDMYKIDRLVSELENGKIVK